ncbi:hypothetical protein COY88_02660 [Candidatus Roizmanbacteria bacterium CG_4_10_14_0_8_um_filter_35_28]|uniref:Nucleotidyltransferase n=2 Tax=Candidatus Roizmaniibacteriota TaxID=1752723 RepID=A0A2G9Y6Z6_9BACT|nr:MAG: hypothetical protein COX47_02210 [Candidatus Roizmanbacteria bacterium CG23_combo_of_CG06-09_8_20_14_all_35_49]PIY71007.1 MAG: hypothetical protein COY88_02660 [Candidatus Roizmanbacteria bacterium CG_4_10_14_0_8_um_filter_35_28]PJC82444.1 MAG: hypothetical protein CO006_03510 [Candidatus Roizmanbacteria bacterium CG_4_8_14_3_um_filter_35_14]
MNTFYQQFLTDKSFTLLTELKKQYRFILIGGWAVFFYTKSLKSKDIDIIVDFSDLQKIKKDFSLEKNERLKKYQIKLEGIDVDIYLPFYSDLGLPVEKIINKTTLVNGFALLEKEILLLTKLKAYQDRKESVKGQKDFIDIISLVLLEDFDFEYFLKLGKKYKLRKSLKLLRELLEKTREVEELNLNKHAFAKKKKEVLKKLGVFR